MGSFPKVQRRVIGNVDIFDLYGNLEGGLIDGIKSYIEGYVKECKRNNVILNIQTVNSVEDGAGISIISILEIPKKKAIYYDNEEILSKFKMNGLGKDIRECSSQKEVLEVFGREMVERDKLVNFRERRKNRRIKVALDSKIDFEDKNGNVIESSAIITNFSEAGIFAEYFDIKSAIKLETFDYFKNVTAKINFCDPISGKEFNKKGSILRMEFAGNQVGIAIEFV